MRELLVRHRAGIERDTCVLAYARGGHHGLQLPGQVSAGIRWRGRLDVLLLPGELRVAGHGGIWRFPVADMVLGSDGGLGPAGLRVDFLMGSPLVVAVRDGGAVLDGLRRQILEYERSLLSGAHVTVWPSGGRLVAAVPAGSEVALTTAIGILLSQGTRHDVDGGESSCSDGAAPGFMARVEGLRSRRWDQLARHGLST